jgi:RNA polymerase sigma-70 factor, ECF subfamily
MSTSNPETRASLLLKLRDSKDIDAWEDFTQIYSPVIHRAARKMGLQTADADNVVQEVLLAVSKSIDQWLNREEKIGFRAWLFRIARNKAIDLLTRKATRPFAKKGESSSFEWNELAQQESAAATHFEFEYQWELFTRAAAEVRQSAAESTWQAFWLTAVEHQTVAIVAEKLGVREGMVYLSRCRIMERIRKLVQQWEGT